MNLAEILSRGHTLKVRRDSKIFSDERYYSFGDYVGKYVWRRNVERFVKSFGYTYLQSYISEDETDKCFETLYESNLHKVERSLKDSGAKFVTISLTYSQSLAGFRKRIAKMTIPIGILFDSMHHKMLYLLKNPNLFNEN